VKRPHTDGVLWTGLLHVVSGYLGLVRSMIALGVSLTGLLLYGASPELGLLGLFLLLSIADALVCGLLGNVLLVRSGTSLLRSLPDAAQWGWMYIGVQFFGGLLTLAATLVFWTGGYQALSRLAIYYNSPGFKTFCWIHALLTTLAVVWAWVPIVAVLNILPAQKAKRRNRSKGLSGK
jgi:hypothetical protein